MAQSAEARTCPVTGFRVHRAAEDLVKANAVAAVVALLLGGLAAIVVLFTRWMGAFPPETFYQYLALHAWNLLIFWIIFFEIALLHFAGSIMLNTRPASPAAGWLAFALMVLGALMVERAILTNPLNHLSFQPYPPLRGTPDFYLGTILFAGGALLGVGVFFATVHRAYREGTHTGPLPLVVFGAFVAAVLAVATLLVGALVFVPAFLWSAGILPELNPFLWKVAYWGFGHPSQQINLAATITVWYLLSQLTVGGRTPSEKVSRAAFVLYLVAINLGSAHHLQTEPSGALSVGWKWINTGYLMHLAVLGSMIHAFAVPGSVEVGQRLRGYSRGLFDWLVRGPWRNPAFSSLVLSVALFGFLGGTTGVIAGTEQLNMKWHNTTAIMGHFHGVVVAGTTLAFMGITWYVLPLIFRRRVVGERWARWQPWLFGIGVGLLVLAFLQLGVRYGLPRKQPDIFRFRGLPLAFQWPTEVYALLTVAGIGGLLALVGGALFVALVVATVLFGKRLTDDELRREYAVPAAAGNPGRSAKELPAVPGTFVLCLVFAAFFVLVYLGNYWNLSRAWPIGG
ncbi:MAG: cbb3-type cytochrome c oxidase subunit I [Armatimonadota bacterium]|nr:cbb3-type cytochrome c oxidase subunit I [Armatimonadota bacterium]